DDLGGWLTRRLDATLGWADSGAAVSGHVAALGDAVAAHPRALALGSPEVGLRVVPDTRPGRLLGDMIGSLNRRQADVCACAVLVVAGRALPLGASHPDRPGRSRPAAPAATGGLTTTPATAIGAAGATGAGSTPGAAGAAAPATDDDHAPGAAGTDGFAGLWD